MKKENIHFKRLMTFAIVLLFVGASLVSSVMSVDTLKTPTVATVQTTWYVDDSGSNGNNGTSWEDAWQDINYAINYSSVVDDDIIRVGDGTYYENVLIIQKKLTIEGNGSSVTTIDGGGVGNVIAMHSPYVKITGFTITNSGPLNGAGICGYYGNSYIIEKNIIEKNHRGIWFYYGRSSRITENVVQDNALGIYLDGALEVAISSNWILNNTLAGIILEDCHQCDITSNLIENNGGWGGLLLYYSFSNEIIRNNFISNGVDDYNHIISRHSRNRFSGNYYEPTLLVNLGVIFRIYVVWGTRHWPQVPDLYIPMIGGIDTSKAEELNSIPYPIS